MRHVAAFSMAVTLLVMSMGWLSSARRARADEPIGIAEERAFQTAAARVADAVVRIESTGVSAAAGGPSTGLVIDPAGWIVTTAFAVPDDVQQAIVVLPDPATGSPERLAARVVGRDTSRGVVLLKAEPPAALPVPRRRWC